MLAAVCQFEYEVFLARSFGTNIFDFNDDPVGDNPGMFQVGYCDIFVIEGGDVLVAAGSAKRYQDLFW